MSAKIKPKKKLIKKKGKGSKIAKSFKKTVNKKVEKKEVFSKIDKDKLVPTGSTTFNLECSGFVEGAFKLGTMVNIIGDSHAGKTLFCLTVLAECSMLKRFDNYRLIFDDVEVANEFDLDELFNKRFSERLETDIISKTVEDLNDNLARAAKDDRPFIYVTDSFDALTTEAAIAKDDDNRKAREKGNQTKGDYGDGKPKLASRMFSQRIQEIGEQDSLLIIISQTRDNIGFGAMFTPKTRSGGKALKFYAFHEVWLACQKKEKEGKRTVVTNVQAKITKNKLNGRHGESYFPVRFDYGIDNTESCINFLRDEGGWSGTRKACNTQGFYVLEDSKGKTKHPSIKQIIDWVEENDKEKELYSLCQTAYDGIMEALKPKRKKKY